MKLGTVDRWHRALAAGAVEEVVALTDPDVAIGGPRGTAAGHDVLRAWARGSGARLEPARWYCGPRGEVTVNGEPESRRGRQLHRGDVVEAAGEQVVVA